ncbi:MAG: helix-hairpin-helix domain-containing protein [Geobacteraceae bacterium]
MKGHPGRFVLWLLMLAVSLLLFLQGHHTSLSEGTVALLPAGGAGPGDVMVHFEGSCVKSGIYQLDSNLSLGTVINMTVPFFQENSLGKLALKKKVYTGDLVDLECAGLQHIEITRDGMPVMEKMILGIPLDLNKMSVGEWEMLPRIGPTLAKRIVCDRQENGGFRSVRDLERVSGIGAATVMQLKKYFVQN